MHNIIVVSDSYFYKMGVTAGKYIIVIGLVLVVSGIIVYFFHDRLGWFGNLPGDIRIEKENFKLYFPVTTMILLSVIASIVLWIFRRIF